MKEKLIWNLKSKVNNSCANYDQMKEGDFLWFVL